MMILAVMLSACASGTRSDGVATARAPSPQRVKIGVGAPTSGQIAELGAGIVNGARMAIDEANADGIKLDGADVVFELVVEDDRADPRTGPDAARRLIERGVVAVVGHLNSGISIPASALYDRARIPMVTPASSNPRLTQQGLSSVFRIVGHDGTQGEGIAEFIALGLKRTSFAVVEDGTTYGRVVCEPVVDSAKRRYALSPRLTTTYSALETSPKSVADRIVQSGADAVVYCGMGDDAVHLFAALRAQGSKAVFIGSDGLMSTEVVSAMRELGEVYASSSDPVWDRSDAAQDFEQRYRRRFGLDVSAYSATSYDATRVLIAAMRAGNSTNSAGLADKIHSIAFKGVTGSIEFSASGERLATPVTLLKLTDGKWAPAWRSGAALMR